MRQKSGGRSRGCRPSGGRTMVADTRYIVSFETACDADHARMGGKCSSLARMIAAGVNVPGGFAVTTDAFAAHVDRAGLRGRITDIAASIDSDDVDQEEAKSGEIRQMIVAAPMPA